MAEEMRRQFVAIVGGFWDLAKNDPVRYADAKKRAEEIGGALAKAGFGLVVYYSKDECLEPHVVSGYAAALPPGTGAKSIRVRFAESQRGEVRFAEQETRKELFDLHLFPGDEWEAPFYRSLVEADGVDAVLLMAGARSTLIAGEIALARPLPVLAVDEFRGSAGIIWSELRTTMSDYPSSESHSPEQMVAWLKARCEARAEEREEDRRIRDAYREIIAQKRKTGWAGGAFLALLLFVVYGTTQAPTPGLFMLTMFASLTAAGATGALVRSILWGAENKTPVTSLILGAIAGVIVGLAYLIPQFMGAPDVLDPAATAIEPTNRIQLYAAVLVSLSAGVGFDTVFTRLKKEAAEHPIGPS